MRRYVIAFAALLTLCSVSSAEVKLGGPTSPDGKHTVMVDLPTSQRAKNVGGRDGAGLCVFTSIMHSARWANEYRLFEFQRQMRAELGGGWPAKVDKMIAKYGPGTEYVQYEGRDPSIVIAAVKSGRSPGVTWNGYRDPHYRGQKIAHMVNCVYHDGAVVCLLDNNFIGENDLVWMSADDFQRGWTGGQQGWAVILCNPPPPPIPTNGLAPVAQWGRGGCGPVGPPALPVQRPAVKRPVKNVQPPKVVNYGVDTRKLKVDGPERYSHNGHECTRRKAHGAVSSPALPDDAGWMRLTFIGPDADAKRLRADLDSSPALAPWRGKLAVQCYAPGSWAIDPALGYPAAGLMIQSPPNAAGRGKVLHRQPAYDGPAALAVALRKADPNYDPRRDPDLTRPQPSPTPVPPVVDVQPSHVVCAVCGLIIAMLLRKRKES